jgi:hypothetical protein
MMQSAFQKLFAGALSGVFFVAGASVFSAASGQEQRPRTGLEEPVYRVSNTGENAVAARTGHPLDPALRLAYEGQERIRLHINDYTAVIAKRERLDGVLPPEPEFMFAKIRNRKLDASGRIVTPFSVYMRFLAPEEKKDREAIYVEGANNGKIVAHGTGVQGLFTVSLDPRGKLAMAGNRYPITDLGMDHMIAELIKKGERDRQRGEIEVQFFKNAKIDDRTCTCLTVTHPEKRDYFDFNVAQIFIDDELNVPIRYAAYQWPTKPGDGPQLDEEYTYLDMKLNVGLTDADFDPRNPDYDFPRINR